uniref:Calx-beta domain-containing protein n=1 Tax=Pedobacter borealis TaxID=475254 RepID=UPI002473766A
MHLLFLVAVLLFTAVNSAFADGSINLYPANGNGIGGRAKLMASNVTTVAFPFPNLGVHYVYAAVGEKITMASSAMIAGTNSFIRLTAPNGSVVQTNNPSGTIPKPGLIPNRNAEIAGPALFGVALGGNQYTPNYYSVTVTGIYKVEFVAPGGINGDGSDRENISYDDNWTQHTYGTSDFLGGTPSPLASIAAWDVSVINTTNTAFIPGRVFTNVLNLDIAPIFENNRGFHGVVNVLTKDGYAYNVDANGQNGIGFTFFANNRGFTTAAAGAGNPTYKSLNYSTSPSVKDPNSTDDALNVTHKIFYTKPSTDLPATATLNNATTWLRIASPVTPTLTNISIKGVEGSNGKISSKGAYVSFTSNIAGTYKITISGGGNFIDRVLIGNMNNAGAQQVYWDARAGTAADPTAPGVKVPPGTAIGTIKAQAFVSEVHFPLIDVEINPNGIIISQTDGSYNPIRSKDIVYWDDSQVTIAGNTSPVSSQNSVNATPSNPKVNPLSGAGLKSSVNGHIWGKYNSNGGQGTLDFGNERSLDTYTFIPNVEKVESVSVTISQADLAVQSITPSVTTAKIGTTLTYTVVLQNKANSESVSDVTGAVFNLEYPDGFVVTSATSVVNSGIGTVSQTASSTTSTKYAATLDMTSGSQVTYTITGTVGASLSNTTIAARATILRPPDVSDPDATYEDPNKNDLTFSGNADIECNGAPSGEGCNNILPADVVTVPASVSIVATTPNASEAGTNGLFTVKLTSAVAGNTVVNYSIGGTATNGTDYNAGTPLTGSVTIPAGITSVNIPVTVVNDLIVEPTETVVLNITSVSNGTTPTTTASSTPSDLTATVNIADDDVSTITVAATADGAEPGTPGQFTFRLSKVSTTDTQVTFSVGGTATSGTDYTSIGTTVTIRAGQPSATVSVPVLDDNIAEGNETVVLTMIATTNNPSITASTTPATVNIRDNRAPVATSPAVTTPEDTPVNGTITATDADGDP